MGNEKFKNPLKLRKSTPAKSDAPLSQAIDLAQDFDDKNSKAKNKRQKKESEFDDAKNFFSEPFYKKDEVSLVFDCLNCGSISDFSI